jgi:hypothetical protein
VEKLSENAKAVEQVPTEVELKAEPEATAPQAEEPKA